MTGYAAAYTRTEQYFKKSAEINRKIHLPDLLGQVYFFKRVSLRNAHRLRYEAYIQQVLRCRQIFDLYCERLLRL